MGVVEKEMDHKGEQRSTSILQNCNESIEVTVREVINVHNYIMTTLLYNFLMQHGKDLKFEMQIHSELVIFT